MSHEIWEWAFSPPAYKNMKGIGYFLSENVVAGTIQNINRSWGRSRHFPSPDWKFLVSIYPAYKHWCQMAAAASCARFDQAGSLLEGNIRPLALCKAQAFSMGLQPSVGFPRLRGGKGISKEVLFWFHHFPGSFHHPYTLHLLLLI